MKEQTKRKKQVSKLFSSNDISITSDQANEIQFEIECAIKNGFEVIETTKKISEYLKKDYWKLKPLIINLFL